MYFYYHMLTLVSAGIYVLWSSGDGTRFDWDVTTWLHESNFFTRTDKVSLICPLLRRMRSSCAQEPSQPDLQRRRILTRSSRDQILRRFLPPDFIRGPTATSVHWRLNSKFFIDTNDLLIFNPAVYTSNAFCLDSTRQNSFNYIHNKSSLIATTSG